MRAWGVRGKGMPPDRARAAFVTIASMGLLCCGVPATQAATVPTANGGDTVGLVDTARGRWYLFDAAGDVAVFFFGDPGDVPLVGDWDCDGVDTVGAYRRSTGRVYLRDANAAGVADRTFFFGDPGDVPVAGDFDGDGCDSVSLYRPSEQRVYVTNRLASDGVGLGAAEAAYGFGDPDDVPFVGDFDGDGIDTVGLHRRSSGMVYLRNSHTAGPADASIALGSATGTVVAGDWSANGTDAPAVFLTPAASWWPPGSEGGLGRVPTLPGSSGWVPVMGSFGDLPDARPVAAGAVGAGPSVLVARGSSDSGRVALTFDAGADAGDTGRILDLLRTEGIHASFGVTGRWAKDNPELLSRIVGEGHHLINHTFSHPTMAGLTTEERWSELDRTEAIVRSLTGTSTLGWFRPPMGIYDEAVLADAGARGYTYTVTWSVESGGWKGFSPATVVHRCLSGVEAGDIILMHVGGRSTDYAALPAVLAGLRMRGLEPVTVPEMLFP